MEFAGMDKLIFYRLDSLHRFLQAYRALKNFEKYFEIVIEVGDEWYRAFVNSDNMRNLNETNFSELLKILDNFQQTFTIYMQSLTKE